MIVLLVLPLSHRVREWNKFKLWRWTNSNKNYLL